MKCIKWEKLILSCLAFHLHTWSWSIFGPTKHDMKRTSLFPPSRACNFSFHFLHNITTTTIENFATKDVSCDIVFYIWLHSSHAEEEKCFFSPNMSACKIARSVIRWLAVVCFGKWLKTEKSTSITDLWHFKSNKSSLLMNVTTGNKCVKSWTWKMFQLQINCIEKEFSCRFKFLLSWNKDLSRRHCERNSRYFLEGTFSTFFPLHMTNAIEFFQLKMQIYFSNWQFSSGLGFLLNSSSPTS